MSTVQVKSVITRAGMRAINNTRLLDPRINGTNLSFGIASLTST